MKGCQASGPPSPCPGRQERGGYRAPSVQGQDYTAQEAAVAAQLSLDEITGTLSRAVGSQADT